ENKITLSLTSRHLLTKGLLTDSCLKHQVRRRQLWGKLDAFQGKDDLPHHWEITQNFFQLYIR
ncbi:MAG: hypothetical protein WDA42_09100, partial [Candidatus Bathyarchaeia archaeon]